MKSPLGLALTIVGLSLAYKIYLATASAIKGTIRFRFAHAGPYTAGSFLEGQVLIRARVKTPAERIVLRLFCKEANHDLNLSGPSYRSWDVFARHRHGTTVELISHDQLVYDKDFTLFRAVELPTHGSMVFPFRIQIPEGVIRPGVGLNPFLDPNYEGRAHAQLHPDHASAHNFKGKFNWYLEARAEIPGADLVERIPIQINVKPNSGAFFG